MRLVQLLVLMSLYTAGATRLHQCQLQAAQRALSQMLPAKVDRLLAGQAALQESALILGKARAQFGGKMANNIKAAPAVHHYWMSLELRRFIKTRQMRQVVLLGAGMDSRAYTESWLNQCTVFEVDAPEVIKTKEELLRTFAFDMALQAKSVHRISACCQSPALCDAVLVDLLQHKGFDPLQKTAFLYSDCVSERLLRLPFKAAVGSAVIFDIRSQSEQKDQFTLKDGFGLCKFGYREVRHCQLGDAETNFGALNTSSGLWPFKTPVTPGETLQRHYFMSAVTGSDPREYLKSILESVQGSEEQGATSCI